MKLQIIEQTKEFVKDAFKKNPHYSFNHWSIMYDHSVRTQELALKIADKITCDKTIVSICALLHDIGKTHKIDVKILHKDHQNFNLIVSEEFLKSLNLNNNDFKKVCDIIRYESDSTEMKIVKDADALALYFDKKLYMLWIAWVFEN